MWRSRTVRRTEEQGRMSTDDVFDLLAFAMEPETWECDDAWEYRAMHWRPSEEATASVDRRAGRPGVRAWERNRSLGGAMSNIGRELPPIEVVPDVEPEPVPESVPEPAAEPV
jgi:hypothetical protein